MFKGTDIWGFLTSLSWGENFTWNKLVTGCAKKSDEKRWPTMAKVAILVEWQVESVLQGNNVSKALTSTLNGGGHYNVNGNDFPKSGSNTNPNSDPTANPIPNQSTI